MLDWNVLCADFTGYLDGIIADHDIPLRAYKSLKIKPINYFSAACLQQCLRALTLLVGWQERHPACKKTWLVDLHMAQLMPLPLTDSFFSKIQIGFTFLVPDHPGSPEKEPLNGCVCVCVCACVRACVCVVTNNAAYFLSAEKRWIGISLFADRITASYHLCGMRDIMTSTLDNMINKLWIQLRVYDTIRYDTIRDAILTCARKPT